MLRSLVLSAVMLAPLGACATDGSDDGGPAADAAVAIDAPPPTDARVIDAPAGTVCATKEPIVQVGYTCQFAWRQCTGTSDRELRCQITNVAGHVFSLCRCIVGGAETGQFTSTTVCGSTTWSAVEAVVNTECGWNLL